MKYLTTSQAAEKWGLTVRRIQQLCSLGEIPGVIRTGRSWKVPEDAEVPVRYSDMASARRGRTETDRNDSGPFSKVWRQRYILPGSPEDIGSHGQGGCGAAEKNMKYDAGLKKRLPLPIGVSDFMEASSLYYYVDKTLMIRDLIDMRPKVSLFTRPRRFGKTLTMDMFRVFFEKRNYDTSVYFRNRKIWAAGSEYQEMQGRYPVIYLTFKDVKYPEWEKAYSSLRLTIQMEFARHEELKGSPKCDDLQKRLYDDIVMGKPDEEELAKSLKVLSQMLEQHYGEKTVIIIDEYDTPIQQGYVHGYYEDAVTLMRNLFAGAFKDNSSLAFGILAGILRVSKESIFSGMNNLQVFSVLDDPFSQYFGFTKDEVQEMLRYYQYPEKMEEVCRWYDGYRFGSSCIFNPWSVLSYIAGNCLPRPFWVDTAGNDIIGELLARSAPEIKDDLIQLMQGEAVPTPVDIGVIYPELKRNPYSIFSFLLVTGYLRSEDLRIQPSGRYQCSVKIPNREISYIYQKEIIARLQPQTRESTAYRIQNAVFDKNPPEIRKEIQKYLLESISYSDSGDEAFYQGLMIGLCAILNAEYEVRSNRESGLGRFDIRLKPLHVGLPAFVFELKAAKEKSEDLRVLAEAAYHQIQDRKYSLELKEGGESDIVEAGIAFRGKEAEIFYGYDAG